MNKEPEIRLGTITNAKLALLIALLFLADKAWQVVSGWHRAGIEHAARTTRWDAAANAIEEAHIAAMREQLATQSQDIAGIKARLEAKP